MKNGDAKPEDFIVYLPLEADKEGIYSLSTIGCGCCSWEEKYTKNEYIILLIEMGQYIGKQIEELTNER
jgi:hypothetical protein